MRRIKLHIVMWIMVSTLATAGVVFAQEQDEVLTQDMETLKQSISEVSESFVAAKAGLDDETMNLIMATGEQRRMAQMLVKKFTRENRPQLLTYRAIWMEMRERYRNLAKSAVENAFDPCQFVTDDALAKARQVMRDAQNQFEQKCHEVHRPLQSVFSATQLVLIQNAAINQELPSPFRWLKLSDDERRAVLRLIRVHEARLKLAERYQHLRQNLSPVQLVDQVRSVLDDHRRIELVHLLEMLSRNGTNDN